MLKVSPITQRAKHLLSKRMPGWYHLYRQKKEILRNLPERAKMTISKLSANDVCIDCGANIGAATIIFAKKGARVFSFEPHPHAYANLVKNTNRYGTVETFEKAIVADDRKRVRLRFTDNHFKNALGASIGASISDTKPNLIDEGADVEATNLMDFMSRQESVAILKIDVEGYEVELVPALIASGCLNRVRAVFLETHSNSNWPELAERTKEMIKMIAASEHADKFVLEWP